MHSLVHPLSGMLCGWLAKKDADADVVPDLLSCYNFAVGLYNFLVDAMMSAWVEWTFVTALMVIPCAAGESGGFGRRASAFQRPKSPLQQEGGSGSPDGASRKLKRGLSWHPRGLFIS